MFFGIFTWAAQGPNEGTVILSNKWLLHATTTGTVGALQREEAPAAAAFHGALQAALPEKMSGHPAAHISSDLAILVDFDKSLFAEEP